MLIYYLIIIIGKALISYNYHSTTHEGKYSVVREPNCENHLFYFISLLNGFTYWKEMGIIRDKILSVKRADMEVIMTGSYRNEV